MSSLIIILLFNSGNKACVGDNGCGWLSSSSPLVGCSAPCCREELQSRCSEVTTKPTASRSRCPCRGDRGSPGALRRPRPARDVPEAAGLAPCLCPRFLACEGPGGCSVRPMPFPGCPPLAGSSRPSWLCPRRGALSPAPQTRAASRLQQPVSWALIIFPLPGAK